jgi:hypothetical protein
MNGDRARLVILDLLYLTLEHVLATLGDVGAGAPLEVIVLQARELQYSITEYWRGQLEPLEALVEDDFPF